MDLDCRRGQSQHDAYIPNRSCAALAFAYACLGLIPQLKAFPCFRSSGMHDDIVGGIMGGEIRHGRIHPILTMPTL